MSPEPSCRETERIWRGQRSRRLPQNIQAVMLRKLRYLDAAESLEDLRSLPANRLEALKPKFLILYLIRY